MTENCLQIIFMEYSSWNKKFALCPGWIYQFLLGGEKEKDSEPFLGEMKKLESGILFHSSNFSRKSITCKLKGIKKRQLWFTFYSFDSFFSVCFIRLFMSCLSNVIYTAQYLLQILQHAGLTIKGLQLSRT